MRNSLRFSLLLALLLAVSACDDGDGRGNSISGEFDGNAVEGPVATRALHQGEFLDVVITAVVPALDGDLTVTIIVHLPAAGLEGKTEVVSTGGRVSADVQFGDQPKRPASGSVTFDAFDPEPGGTVAGTYDLVFVGGSLQGEFDATVE